MVLSMDDGGDQGNGTGIQCFAVLVVKGRFSYWLLRDPTTSHSTLNDGEQAVMAELVMRSGELVPADEFNVPAKWRLCHSAVAVFSRYQTNTVIAAIAGIELEDQIVTACHHSRLYTNPRKM